ncbi:hypothetical protein TNCV_1086231 [Trichonephila clavipes]|nr:hypothetical protein TNCV_1086231 [Trichonephila clavipes]
MLHSWNWTSKSSCEMVWKLKERIIANSPSERDSLIRSWSPPPPMSGRKRAKNWFAGASEMHGLFQSAVAGPFIFQVDEGWADKNRLARIEKLEE